MKNTNVRKWTYSAVFAAIVFVATAYLPKISVPMTGGYAHLGDTFIYMAAAMLPFPYALYASAVGAALADVLTGYGIWAPFTLLIKAAMAWCFTSKKEKLLSKRNFLALLVAGIMNVGGYYIAEAVITYFGAKELSWAVFATPLGAVPYNIGQSAVSAILFVLIAVAADKADLKKRLL